MPLTPKQEPSAEKLNEVFTYDENTGNLIRKSGKRAGEVAGCKLNTGYIKVSVGSDHFLAHRLIWIMKTGSRPENFLDHRDGDKSNNRWDNLRPATHQQNMMNRKTHKNNTSGETGVCWDKRASRWRGFIKKDGKLKALGSFKTKDEAAAVVASARQETMKEFLRS